MGAGKSTIGAQAAARLDRPFVDVDRELEAELGAPVAEVFASRGEATFREAEEDLTVEALADPQPAALALGGGALGSLRVSGGLAERALAGSEERRVGEACRPRRPPHS